MTIPRKGHKIAFGMVDLVPHPGTEIRCASAEREKCVCCASCWCDCKDSLRALIRELVEAWDDPASDPERIHAAIARVRAEVADAKGGA